MRGRQNVGINAIVLDLSSTSKPVAEGQRGLPRSPEIPAVYIAIDGAGSQKVRVVGGEVDVGDGAAVSLEGVLDRTRRRVVPQVQVPNKATMVGCRSNPIVTSGKRRPLNIDHEPRKAMAAQPSWWAPRGVEVYNGQAIRARGCNLSLPLTDPVSSSLKIQK